MIQSEFKEDKPLEKVIDLHASLTLFQREFLNKINIVQQNFMGPAVLSRNYFIKEDFFGTCLVLPYKDRKSITPLDQNELPDCGEIIQETEERLILFFEKSNDTIKFKYCTDWQQEKSYNRDSNEAFDPTASVMVSSPIIQSHKAIVKQEVRGRCTQNDLFLDSVNSEEIVFDRRGKLISYASLDSQIKITGYLKNLFLQMLRITGSWKMTMMHWDRIFSLSSQSETEKVFHQFKMDLKAFISHQYGKQFYFKRLQKLPIKLLKSFLKLSRVEIMAFQALYYNSTKYFKRHGKVSEDLTDHITFYYECQFNRFPTLVESVYFSYYYSLPFSKFIIKADSFNHFLRQIDGYIHPDDNFDNWMLPSKVNFQLRECTSLFSDIELYDFQLIRNNQELWKEGERMRNCADNYRNDVAAGRFIFYHINHKKNIKGYKNKGFTLRLDRKDDRYYLGELRAFANKKASSKLRKEICLKLQIINLENTPLVAVEETKVKRDYIATTLKFYQRHFKKKLTIEEQKWVSYYMRNYSLPFISNAKNFSDIKVNFEKENPELNYKDPGGKEY